MLSEPYDGKGKLKLEQHKKLKELCKSTPSFVPTGATVSPDFLHVMQLEKKFAWPEFGAVKSFHLPENSGRTRSAKVHPSRRR
jgi:hypothetical protein